MQDLSYLNGFVVRQIKEWGEILTGIEFRNKYSVKNENGEEMFFAYEEKKSFLALFFLTANRPFTIHVIDKSKNVQISIHRPHRWLFHECKVVDDKGALLGHVKWQFSILKKLYQVLDESGNEILNIVGPIFKPWTFNVMRNGQQIAQIQKKWSGFGKEMLTDADIFGVKFEQMLSDRDKALLLGTVFFLDFMHFESKD